jgi:Icc-related predicted phosphoesterase
MKKLVFISDTHRQYNGVSIPECDFLIFCGDEDLNSEQSCLIFNDWLGEQPAKNIVMTVGNHDFYAEENPEEFKKLMTNAKVLIDKYLEIDGLKIYGTPWTPTFYDWAFMKPDLNLAKVFANIPTGLDILITHGPPMYILDQNSRYQHCGSQSLYNAVKEKAPKINCFGHIHEARGEVIVGDTRFINAACCPVWTSDGLKEFAPIILEI